MQIYCIKVIQLLKHFDAKAGEVIVVVVDYEVDANVYLNSISNAVKRALMQKCG